jgi:hypothetical protein
LRLKIVLRLVLKLVFRGNIDGLAINIVGQHAVVLREILAQAYASRRCRSTSRRAWHTVRIQSWNQPARNFCLPSERKPSGTPLMLLELQQVNGVQIVIPRSKMPAISEFIFDLKIGLLGVGIGKLALYKPQRKLLQDGRTG